MVKEKAKVLITKGAVIHEPGNSTKNKTGNWRILKPVKDSKKCTKCGLCWMYCPENAIDEKFRIDMDDCKGCGICARECPFGAIHMEKEEK